MMRWQIIKPTSKVTMASFLSRGKAPVDLSVKSDESMITVSIKSKGWKEKIVLSDKLTPIEDDGDGN